MKTKRFFILLLLLPALLSACGSKSPADLPGQGGAINTDNTTGAADPGSLEGVISISGAFALYPMMTRWAEEFTALHPGVEFDISAGGAGKGMADALAGAVDIGMVSRDITPEEEANGAYWVAVTKDAVFPTVSADNPVLPELLAQGITQGMFRKVFLTGEIKTWGELVGRPEITDEIHVFTRSDACGAAETWAKYLGGKQEDLLGVAVFGDPGLLDAVIQDPLGIGYNNLNYAYDMGGSPVEGVAIAPIDQDEDGTANSEELLETKDEAVEMVATGRYPSPPARALNLVTKGKPIGVVQAFIEWIITEGQAFVSEAGYVQLTEEQLAQSLAKVR
jgi:phosphate transport system substrate-binding protein